MTFRKNYFIPFVLVSLFACKGASQVHSVSPADPLEEPNQVGKQSHELSGQSQITMWSGKSGPEYCHAGIKQFQTKSDSIQRFSKKTLLGHARQFEVEGRLQEAIWLYQVLGRHHKAEALRATLESILSEEPLEEIPHDFGGAGTVPKMVLRFNHNVDALFKPDVIDRSSMSWANSSHEAAVYKMDQFLGTNIVPMTLYRHVRLPNGEVLKGSLQYWMKSGVTHGRNTDASSSNFPAMKVLDYVTANADRKDLNFLFWPDLERLVAIDNGFAFVWDGCGEPTEIVHFLNLSPKLKERFQQMDEDHLEHTLSVLVEGEITPEQVHKMVLRIRSLRDQIKESR